MMTTLRRAAPVRRAFRAFGLAGGVAAVLICAGCASSSAASGTSPAPGNSPAAVPVLGRPAGVFAHGAGFGQVKPAKIFNGGDPTGLLTHITWKSWGGPDAVGTGKTDYVGPGQSVATGKEEQATVEAFKLGKCHRKLMYKAVEWYFPQHGQAFSASHYENICQGTYVPTP
jgi:hypothetical protein